MPTQYRVSGAAGEIGEQLYGRPDIAKYGVAVAQAKDVFIEPEGPISNRAGTIFVADVGTTDVRLMRFVFDDDEQYVLVFTPLVLRFLKAGTLDFLQDSGADYEVVTPYTAEHLRTLKAVQKDDFVYLLHPLYAPRVLTRSGDTSWTLALLTTGPSIAAPTSPSAVAGAGGTATRNSVYKVAALAGGEESLPTAEFSDAGAGTSQGAVTLTWTASAGAERYVIYKEENGLFGYIGATEELTFVDDGFDPDTTDTPQGDRNPFDGSGNYPGVGARYQQRLILTNSVNAPVTLEMSQTGFLQNFNFSEPQEASDAIELELDVEIRGEIRSLVTLNGLFVLTSNQVFELRSREGLGLSPGQIDVVSIFDEIGASPVDPVRIMDSFLFVESTGDRVQALRRLDEYAEKMQPSEVSVMAPHFFRGKSVRAWAYARSPFSLTPTVMDDGTCVVLTYVYEHDVWGWTEWRTATAAGASAWRDVVVIREDSRSVPYFVVERTIDGATATYVEKLADRLEDDVDAMCFVDSAVIATGASSTTWAGFDHLEGETLVGLADGKVVRDVPVSGGAATIPFSASSIVLGLDYRPLIQELPPARGRERKKGVDRVWIDLLNSSTIEAGQSLDAMTVAHTPLPAKFSGQATLRTDVVEIPIESSTDREAQVFVRVADPLPATIRGVFRGVQY